MTKDDKMFLTTMFYAVVIITAITLIYSALTKDITIKGGEWSAGSTPAVIE